MAAVGRLFQDWADMIDTLTLHPVARRKVARPLGEFDAVWACWISRIRIWNPDRRWWDAGRAA